MASIQNNFNINWDQLFPFFPRCVPYSISLKCLHLLVNWLKDSTRDWWYHFFFKLAIPQWTEWWDERANRGTLLGAVSLFPSPWTITSHFWIWLWWRGQSEVSQACRHICFNPARQSSMPQLFKMFLLISIMKGLIMLMRRPNGLVLSVGDTAVGLQAKSCAKCVT